MIGAIPFYRTHVESSIDWPGSWLRSGCHLYANVRQFDRDDNAQA